MTSAPDVARDVAAAVDFCPLCGAFSQFGPGPNRRPRASCRWCRSLERHRMISLLLAALPPVTGGTLLDIAPMPAVAPLLRELSGGRYLSVDLDPAADGRAVEAAASVTHLPLRDASVGLLVCYHVLEHVPDDSAAIAELARVLRPDGLGLVQVPRRAGPTEEDPSAPVEERIRRFGQADHVRYYGSDFEQRLESGGLALEVVTPATLLPAELVARARLMAQEEVWLVRPAGGAAPDLDALRRRLRDQLPVLLVERAADAVGRLGTPDALRREEQQATARAEAAEDRLRAAEDRLRAAEASARHWERSYRRLREHPAVRALAGTRSLTRELLDRGRAAAQRDRTRSSA